MTFISGATVSLACVDADAGVVAGDAAVVLADADSAFAALFVATGAVSRTLLFSGVATLAFAG